MPPTPAEREFFIVFNPGSGSQDKQEAREAIEQTFRAAGARHRFMPVEDGNVRATCIEAARLASAADGVLVAVGGDGTINTAAQAAHAEDCTLGVIAQGTFNLFARDHQLPLDARAAAEALLSAQPVPVQVGAVNQQLFLVNASLGLYPKILEDREEAKQRLGRKRWVAFLAALRSLFQWHTRLVLDTEMDGEVRHIVTPSIFVCNNRLQLGRVGIDPAVVGEIGAGRLGGIVSRELTAWAKLRLVFQAAVGRLEAAPEIQSFAVRSLTVTTRHARKMRVALDGEVFWMQLPLRIAVAVRPLKVLLPQGGQPRTG